MKHLKKFNENIDNALENLNSLAIDLVDLLGMELRKQSAYEMDRERNYYNKDISLKISNGWVLEQDVWVINIYDQRNKFIKKEPSKGADCFYHDKIANIMTDAAELGKELLKATEVSIGSFGSQFYIVYFTKSIDKKYNINDMYGAHVIKNITNGFLHTNNMSHHNCLDIYDNSGRIKGMYSLLYYYDNWFYNNPIGVVSMGDTYDVINDIWEKTCDKLNIKNTQRVFKNYKITVPEFLDTIKNYDKTEPIKI